MSAVRAIGGTTLCESCGHRPAVGRVVLAGTAPFAVCADCAPTSKASHGVRVVVANTRTPAEAEQPSEPGWQGCVPLPARPAVVSRRVLQVVAAPAGALTVWLATHDPAAMVAAGVVGFGAVLLAEQRRPRRRG